MSRLLGHLTKQKRQKRKDVRAVKSNVSDAAGAMDSVYTRILFFDRYARTLTYSILAYTYPRATVKMREKKLHRGP